MRVLTVAGVLFLSGCYAEITGSFYKVDQEGGTALMGTGDSVKGTGWGLGGAVGVALDFWRFTRVSGGYALDAALGKTEMDGSARATVAGVHVRVDQKLMPLGGKALLAVTGAVTKGSGKAKYEPSEGTSSESDDSSGLGLYLGGTLALYQHEHDAYSPWAYHLSGGLAYLSSDTDILGDTKAYGPQVRLQVTYGNNLIARFTGRGGASASGEGAFELTLDSSEPMIALLGKAMHVAGCTHVQVMGEQALRGECGGTTMAVVQSGPSIAVACRGPGIDDETCKQRFAQIIQTATR